MLKLFGILLLGFAGWELRAMYRGAKAVKPIAGGVASVPDLGIGYALFMVTILLVMGVAILIGLF